MSKLNRKEFKDLLLEWNNNIISEKDFKSLSIPGWSELSKEQEEIVKSVNFSAIMLNFPIPNDLLKTKPNKKLHKIFQIKKDLVKSYLMVSSPFKSLNVLSLLS